MLAYLVGIFFLVLAGWLIALATGWQLPFEVLNGGLDWLRFNRWKSLVIAISFLVLGLIPFFRPRQKVELSFQTTSKWGEVRVSKEALIDIITRSSQSLGGVYRVEPQVRQREDGLEILLQSQLEPDAVIPEITEELQSKVKDDIEHCTGIKVGEVKVLVRRLEKSTLAQPTRHR